MLNILITFILSMLEYFLFNNELLFKKLLLRNNYFKKFNFPFPKPFQILQTILCFFAQTQLVLLDTLKAFPSIRVL